MKKKNLTKSQITEKLLNKYEVSLNELNYDALKRFKESKDLSDTRQKGKVKYGILSLYLFSLFLAIVMIKKKSESLL